MRNQYRTNTRTCQAITGGAFSGLTMVALGALAMYYGDPSRGRQRRALVRDKFHRTFSSGSTALRKTAEYARDRSYGMYAEARRAFQKDDADDYTIAERVRSAMGRAVAHPRSIQVSCHEGVVTLRGQVLAHEEDDLISAVSKVRGVNAVDNQLDVRSVAEDTPSLQGAGRRQGKMRENWSPLARLCTTIGGAGLCLYGLTRRDILGFFAIGAGCGFAARGITNLPARRLTGIGAGRRAIDVHKTITIDAPPDAVFKFFANYENFPYFMSNIREVRADNDSGQSRWVVAGPMGIEVEWNAELTAYVPNQMIAWRSVEGSTVQNAGMLRFQPERGGTRVDIQLSYNPPAGALGHIIARLFGADPKSEMDADLARVKTTIETGQFPRDAAQPLIGVNA